VWDIEFLGARVMEKATAKDGIATAAITSYSKTDLVLLPAVKKSQIVAAHSFSKMFELFLA
jgi:hypothetical protein